ncbi:glutathione transferase [Trifolium repens]|nr:glutathione transferase [Trifolium repens]
MAISSSLPTNNNSLFSVSRPHFHNYSLHNKLHLRRRLNSVRKLSGVPVPTIGMATEYVCFFVCLLSAEAKLSSAQ